MADIVYVLYNKPYINLTNQCPCDCTFCIRNNGDSVGTSENMWHEKDPSQEDVFKSLNEFDFSSYNEVVFCGYGEPTMAKDNLIFAAKMLKEQYPNIKIRVDTNGLSKLIWGKSIVKDIAPYIDMVSVSLNAPTAEKYNEVTRPKFGIDSFQCMLEFAKECKEVGLEVRFTLVDVISKQDIEDCKKIANDLQIPLHIREYVDTYQ